MASCWAGEPAIPLVTPATRPLRSSLMKAWASAAAQRRRARAPWSWSLHWLQLNTGLFSSLNRVIPTQGDMNNRVSRLTLFIWSVSILCDQNWEWANESWRAWNRENRKLRIGFDDLWSVLTCVTRGPGHNRGAGYVAVEEDVNNELGGLLLNKT